MTNAPLHRDDYAVLNAAFSDAPDSALAALDWAYGTFGDGVTIASSFSIEDIVVIALACKAAAKHRVRPHVFMLDTGRLHQETYDAAAAVRARLPIELAVLAPERAPLEAFVNEAGPNAFYESLDLRHRCCGLRKVEPLSRALVGRSLWVTGLRREQAVTRAGLERVGWDDVHGLHKLNPILDLSEVDVRAAIAAQDLPYNPLQDQGFRSIGCAPCTRAIGPADNIRAGRWWWEEPEHRECGLHLRPQ